jgi:hypothetical protein
MILNVLSSGSKLKIADIAPIFYDVAEKFIKQLPPDLPYVFLSTKAPQTNYLIIDAFPSDYHINDRFYYQSTHRLPGMNAGACSGLTLSLASRPRL